MNSEMTFEQKARRVQTLRKMIKAAETELEELRNSLMQEIDSTVKVQSQTHWYPASAFQNAEQVLDFVLRNMPGNILVSFEYDEKDWKITTKPEPRYVKASFNFGDLELKRTITEPAPTVDLDLLRSIDPVMAAEITTTKTTVELDEEKMMKWLENFPGDMTIIQRALKSRKPNAVLRITEKKDEE